MYDCEKWLELIPKLNVWMHAQLELSVSQQTEEIIRRSKRRNIEPEKENEQKIMNVCTLSIRVRQNEQPTFFQATFSICGHIINGPFLFCAAVRIRLCTKCAFFRSRSAQYTWFVFNFVGTLASYSHARVFVCECRCSIIFKSSHSHNAHYEIVHRHSAKRSNREKNEEVFFCLKKPHFVHQTIHHVLIYALNASKLVVVVTTHFNVL